jgi:DNA invertase Pin-like site-specific DNA recombinase
MGDVIESNTVPGKDREEDSGRYTTSYPGSDFINAIQTLDGMAGTSEIAKNVGCTRRTAYKRLQSLESEGKVSSRKVGNSLVWTMTE